LLLVGILGVNDLSIDAVQRLALMPTLCIDAVQRFLS